FEVALDTAVAQLRQAEVLARQAQADFDRIQRLVASGAVSRKNADDVTATRNARQAQMQSAKAAVAAARLELSWTRITAPIAGRVDRILVTRGNLVSGGVAGNATLLTTIVSHNPMYVYFDIDEATWLKALRHTRSDKNSPVVNMGLTTDNGLPYQGVLDFMGNQMNRSTGTIRARAVIPDPNGMLSPGLFARISLPIGEPRETVLIDDMAVSADQGKNYVLIVGKENQVEYRPVELGQMVDGLRVVTQGVQPGEKIILKGLVRPGMTVAPRLVPMRQNVTDKQTATLTKADGDSAPKAVRQ
ncbi:multidrug efflux RND transporter periplasmic adaptor subunit MdsA, partial [Salmonella enterica subsp. enterica serovar Enteritidis]|nr:multidrug efflux RND transporter periplasmic adaptor subunit MdsA [Salmonella enterica subsp. enterica serovar Enteritidis]EGW9731995.1 multidrug efflux RND transporter periplasmic adaptor subunit MdsA [Salmonella enterica subsp. enterica serovar Enteritidis]